jgi:hypothetical protein
MGQGYSADISMTVANEGDFAETSNLTLCVNTSAISSRIIALASGSSISVIFTWNTSDIAPNLTIEKTKSTRLEKAEWFGKDYFMIA